MILSQKTMPWGNHHLGTSIFYIWAKGCLITEIAEIIGVSPDEVNEALNNVNGFAVDGAGQKCLVIWKKIEEAFPGIKVNRVFTYDDVAVKAALAAGNSVIVEVPATPIGGTGSHFVRYIGDHKLHDPWTGTERPVTDFPNPKGYAILSGTHSKVVTTTPPATQTPTAVIGEYKGLDLHNIDSMKIAIDVWKDVADGKYLAKTTRDQEIALICEALGIDRSSPVSSIVESIKALKENFATQVITQVIPDPAHVEGQGPVSQPIQPSIKNAPQHEKEAVVSKADSFIAELKTLLGI